MLARIFDGKCAKTLRAPALVDLLERGIRPSTNSAESPFCVPGKKIDFVTWFAVFPLYAPSDNVFAFFRFRIFNGFNAF